MEAKHKYETQLTNFRFDSFHEQGQNLVQWYRLDESDEETCGLSMDLNTEIKQLEAFFLKMADNFTLRNYIIVPDEEELYVSDYDLLPNDRPSRPKYLILRKDGQLDAIRSACMEIQLLAPNGTIQRLAGLPFPIIGEIV